MKIEFNGISINHIIGGQVPELLITGDLVSINGVEQRVGGMYEIRYFLTLDSLIKLKLTCEMLANMIKEDGK